MFACAKEGCSGPAEWEPTVVIAKETEEVRVGLPVAVCTAHRRGLRHVLPLGGIPALEPALAERGVDLHATVLRFEFTPLN